MEAKEFDSVQSSPESLSRKQQEAIPHLVGARSLQEGCRKAKISKSTMFTWLKNPAFNFELQRVRQAMITESLERLKGGITEAIEELLTLTKAKEKTIKLRACQTILNLYLKVREADEFEKRLEKIEQFVLERRQQ